MSQYSPGGHHRRFESSIRFRAVEDSRPVFASAFHRLEIETHAGDRRAFRIKHLAGHARVCLEHKSNTRSTVLKKVNGSVVAWNTYRSSDYREIDSQALRYLYADGVPSGPQAKHFVDPGGVRHCILSEPI
jgi:hypothetical protein